MVNNRKELKIIYKFDDNGCLHFIAPCSDEIPVSLFCDILSALNKVQKQYNKKIVYSRENIIKSICNSKKNG